MEKNHHYTLKIEWTGNQGSGTTSYQSYERSHTISAVQKPDILASSDIPFRGDGSKYNPEEFLLASLSSCHMLWYLHLCADAGIIVTDYIDQPSGVMVQLETGGGHFTGVTLNPIVTVSDQSMLENAYQLHSLAHKKCFIAQSVNFNIEHLPMIKVANT